MPSKRNTLLTAVAVVLTAVVAGCDRTPGAGSPAAPASAEAKPKASDAGTPQPAERVRPDAPGDRPDASQAPAKIRADLRESFDLIEGRRSGPARVRLRKQLDVNPTDAQALFLFGLSYHREKRYALARPWYESALSADSSYFTTQYFLGWCLYYLGEPEAARRAFEAHVAKQPGEADSQFALGLIELDDDRFDEAESRFRRAIEIESAGSNRPKEISKAYARLADVSIRRGEWSEARAELELATRAFPDHYEAFYKLSHVLERLGESDAAQAARRQFEAARGRAHPGTAFPE